MTLQRTEGWPERLATVVEQAHCQPYQLGVWDCLRFSCSAIGALTGVDFWENFNGKYSNRREALRVILSIAKDLRTGVSKYLEVEEQPLLMSSRGDLVLFMDEEGEHLGVCLGSVVAVLGELGLVYVSLTDTRCVTSWRVG
jgi:hypothetical protein